MNDFAYRSGRAYRIEIFLNLKIMDVYALEGKPENFAFYVHGQGHSGQSDARQLMYAWLDNPLIAHSDGVFQEVSRRMSGLGLPKPDILSGRGRLSIRHRVSRVCHLDAISTGAFSVTDG